MKKIAPYILVVSFIWMFWILSYVYHITPHADEWWTPAFFATLGAVYAISCLVSGAALAAILGRFRSQS